MRVLSILILTLLSEITTAKPAYQPVADILDTARTAIQANLPSDSDTEIQLGRIDPRLRLPYCEYALEADLTDKTRTSGNQTVAVRCRGGKSWLLYVTAAVRIKAPVAVLVKPLARGEALTEQHFNYRKTRIDRLSAHYFTPESAPQIGLVATRSLKVGAVLTDTFLKRPIAIKRGQVIKLIGDFGNIQVETTARAQSNAAIGDSLRVKQVASGRILDAIASSSGTARLPRQKARLADPNLQTRSQENALLVAKEPAERAATIRY